MRPDILLFMSDQHAPQFMAGAEMEVDTPNLDALRREGTSFSEAYTACPLCVPARMAMLSSMRAARTGIFTNNDALPDTLPTFLHHLVIRNSAGGPYALYRPGSAPRLYQAHRARFYKQRLGTPALACRGFRCAYPDHGI